MSRFIKLNKPFVVVLVICIFFIFTTVKLENSKRMFVDKSNSGMFILFIHELDDVIMNYNENEDGVYVTEYDNGFRDISSLLTRFEVFEDFSEYVYSLYARYNSNLSSEEYLELLELKISVEIVYEEYRSEIYKILPKSHKESKTAFQELVDKYE